MIGFQIYTDMTKVLAKSVERANAPISVMSSFIFN